MKTPLARAIAEAIGTTPAVLEVEGVGQAAWLRWSRGRRVRFGTLARPTPVNHGRERARFRPAEGQSYGRSERFMGKGRQG
jgi:hypothetical protein